MVRRFVDLYRRPDAVRMEFVGQFFARAVWYTWPDSALQVAVDRVLSSRRLEPFFASEVQRSFLFAKIFAGLGTQRQCRQAARKFCEILYFIFIFKTNPLLPYSLLDLLNMSFGRRQLTRSG